MADPKEPLRPPVFHILLALADGPSHGLGIADAVVEATGGAMELGPGTLYRCLKEMAAQGLIAESPSPRGSDPRRRYYRITAAGRKVAEWEAVRLARVVDEARRRHMLPERA